MNLKIAGFIVIAVAAFGIQAQAHHSFAMFDQNKLIALKGSVAEFYWINPHGHIILKVDAGPGVDPKNVGEWDIECASTNIMRLQGWSSTTLKAGDQITIWVPSESIRRHIVNQYHDALFAALESLGRADTHVRFVVGGTEEDED